MSNMGLLCFFRLFFCILLAETKEGNTHVRTAAQASIVEGITHLKDLNLNKEQHM